MRRKLRDQCLGREKPVERRVWHQRDRTEAPPHIFNWNNFRFWEGVEFCVMGQGDTGFFLLLTCSCSLWVRLLHILSLRPYLAPPIPASTRQRPMLLKQAMAITSGLLGKGSVAPELERLPVAVSCGWNGLPFPLCAHVSLCPHRADPL